MVELRVPRPHELALRESYTLNLACRLRDVTDLTQHPPRTRRFPSSKQNDSDSGRAVDGDMLTDRRAHRQRLVVLVRDKEQRGHSARIRHTWHRRPRG